MKSYVHSILVMLFLSGTLFFANPTYAEDPCDDPGEPTEGCVSSGLYGATQQLPGGGYAYADVILSWSPVSASGKAKTGLSNGAQGTYSVCSEVFQVLKNSVYKGSASQQCASKTAGQSLTRTKTVLGAPYQATWQVDTHHGVSSGGFSWWPSQSLTYYIP